MNFFKFQAASVVQTNAEQPLSDEQLRLVQSHLRQAQETKDAIVVSNLPLAIKIASRFSRSIHHIQDLVSVGAESLMRACESYDCARNVTFYTYASSALYANYSRAFKIERRAAKTVGPQEQGLAEPKDHRSNPLLEDSNHRHLTETLCKFLDGLEPRQRAVLRMRSLDELTFLDIGRVLGISKQGAQAVFKRAFQNLARVANIDPRDDMI